MSHPTRELRAFLGAIVLAVSLLTLPVAVSTAPAQTSDGNVSAAGYNPDTAECDMLRKINAYRKSHNEKSLLLSRDLGASSEYHSKDMAEKNYFSHDLKGGTSWEENIRNFGYKGSPIGENIAAGYESVGKTFKQWQHSAEHRRNMLDKSYKVIGIGRAYDGHSEFGWYWTTDFGGDVDNTIKC